jgi:hypothetical protein
VSGVPYLATLPALAGPPSWMRGPATFQNGCIVLDRARTSRYEPHLEGVERLPFVLADVRAPRDAVEFAQRFGLLRTKPDENVYCEPFVEWTIATSSLRDALALYASVRAAKAGDEDAAERCVTILRNREWAASDELRVQLADHPGPLAQASITIAAILSWGIHEVRHVVQPWVLVESPDDTGAIRTGETAAFVYQPICETLAQLAFHVAAAMICRNDEVRTCRCGCRRSFIPTHGRQLYVANHANTARQRRHRARTADA